MAGVNFAKIHTKQHLARIIRHCDSEKRKKDSHTNKHIDKNLTDQNIQVGGSYEDVMNYFNATLDELDKMPHANKRKDRVLAFSLDMPYPPGFDELPDKSKDIIRDRVFSCFESFGGVVLGLYEHCDERHEYTDENGEKVMSRSHIHAVFLPIMDGKLNGREFSSRKRMISLNNEIHGIFEEYGMQFMTGKKKKSKQTVEELKELSDKREQIASELQRLQTMKMTARNEIRAIFHTEITPYREKLAKNIANAANDISNQLFDARNIPVRLKEVAQRGNEFDIYDNSLEDEYTKV